MSTAKKPKRERSHFDSSTAMDKGFLRTFSTLAKALNQSFSLETILTTTLELTLTDPRVEAGEIYLLDEKSGELSYAFHLGLSEECVQEAQEVPIRLGEGLTGHVAVQKEPIVVLELSQEPRFPREMPKTEGYRALISLPIKSGDRIYGVLNLFSREGHRFSSRYVERLVASMDVVGLAFDYFQLFEEREKAERKLHFMFESIQDGIIVVDLEGHIVEVNEATLRMTGYRKEDLIGQNAFEFLTPDDGATAMEAVSETIEIGAGRKTIVYTVLAANGTEFDAEFSGALMHDSSGNPAGFIGIMRDITERKLAEEELRDSKEISQGMVESAATGIYIVQDGKFQYVSPQIEEMSGYTRDEMMGRESLMYIHPEDREAARKSAIENLKGESSSPHEFRFIRKDGQPAWILEKVASIQYRGERAAVGSLLDITERKRAEQQIIQHSRELEALYDVALTTSQTLELDQLLDDVLAKLLEVMEVEAGVMYLWDIRTTEFLSHAHRGVSQDLLREVGRIKLEEDELERARQWGDPPVRLEEILNEATLTLIMEAVAREGLQMLTVVPLRSKNVLHGVMAIASHSERWFTPENTGLLRAIGNQIAVAIENASLFQDTKDKAERLAVTAKLTRIIVSSLDIEEVFDAFAAGIRRLLDASQIAVSLVDGNKVRVFAASSDAEPGIKVGEVFQLKGSATGKVMKNKRTIIEADLAQARQFASDETHFQRGLRSAIRIPLFSRAEVFGTFSLFSKRPNAYGQREVEILEELAGQIAVAIDNDRLYQETKEHVERTAVTAELTRILVSSLNVEEVFGAFVAGVRRLVDFDRASISLIEGEYLRFLAVSSDVETGLSTGAIVPLKDTTTAWVVQNKRTNIETDFSLSMQFPIDEIHFKGGLRSAICLPLFYRGEVFGTFSLLSCRPNAYGQRELEILGELAGQMAIAIQNDKLFAEVKQRKDELEMAYDQLMTTASALDRGKRELENAYLNMARTLVLTLEARDPYTRGHSERVAQISRQVAFEMGLSHDEVKNIETAARLHDLGKIGIPDSILLRPGPITPSERAEIQLHPTRAVELLRLLGFLNGVLPIVESHHERYNGGGYPESRRGEETPLGARILAVADAYDAMTSARPYRPPMSHEEATEVLKKGAGKQWDHKVVEAFLGTFDK